MNQRDRLLDSLDGAHVDVAIIGAGINGAVTAAALSAAGVRTALVDKGDFSGFTSQESSNLVWGGFKYLQSYEFGLVRKLCQSRNRLAKAYPSQVEPIEFLATFDDDSPYPVWLAGLGAAAYWAIGNFATAPPKVLRRDAVEATEPVINTAKAKGGLIYADAYLPDNDARFTFGFIKRAIDTGALAGNYSEVTSTTFDGATWTVSVTDTIDGRQRQFTASAIVNATGPWIDRLNEHLEVTTDHKIALSKGIHLVVPRIGSGERVFAFFDEDDRLYYVIPMGDRSVIGTTDTRVESPNTSVSDEDRDFVLRQINARLDLDQPLTPDDVISSRCGVRPLVVDAGGEDENADWLQLSRKHVIEVDQQRRVVSIFGGKLTDCLNVGEEVLEAVQTLSITAQELDDSWYGEPTAAERARFDARIAANKAVADDTADILWRRYGKRANYVLDRVAADSSLGEVMWEDPRYIKAEIIEIGEHEMIAKVDDFLRRRTSLSLTEHATELEDRVPEIAELLGVPAATSS